MKVVVVGGVAAGMSAAARSRRLSEGAEIVVIERTEHVSFANCGLPYHIGGEIEHREALLLQTPQTLAETLNLDVRIGHEVTAIDRARRTVEVTELQTGRRYTEAYDRLVLCPGAHPIRPPLPGIDHPRIHTLRNIEDMDAIIRDLQAQARRAVVIGGGYIGVEMAENLRHGGLEVDVVEMANQIMPPLDAEMARDLQYHLEYHGVRLRLGTAAAAFADANGRVAVTLANGVVLHADIVIMAAGVRPDSKLAQAAGLEVGAQGGIKVDDRMRTSDPNIYAAGDAVEVVDTVSGEPAVVPLAGPGNRQGRIVADHIFGRDTRYGGTQGTAIVKVFEMTGGGTGASEKALKRRGTPYRKVYLHPSGHASYYPGTAPMHMKVLFSPDEGRLLGAQVVGFDGVDKRIDVLATALRAGMTVFDLEELELAYAPPYGAAKDPVNMAGFIGSNLLRGDIDLWYAEDYPQVTQGGTIVDVRSPIEYRAWHIPEAANIPLGELRRRMHEIPTGKPVFLYCRVGFRSYLAHRALVQCGYGEVRTLAGGSKTFCSFHRTPLCTGRPGVPFVPHAEEKLAETADPGCAA
jgi:NADPH-dependent 2,4-dienoyl-CoA reductase/sulfur reductase-like enzyme/rhodanese-related sulfurtransferase